MSEGHYVPLSALVPLRWKLIGLVVGILAIVLAGTLGLLVGIDWLLGWTWPR